MISRTWPQEASVAHQSVSKETPMTDDMMNLRTLVKKTPDVDLLGEMSALPPSG